MWTRKSKGPLCPLVCSLQFGNGLYNTEVWSECCTDSFTLLLTIIQMKLVQMTFCILTGLLQYHYITETLYQTNEHLIYS